MKKLLANLEPVIEKELAEANRNYPLFASKHEGMGVIEEEIWETMKDYDNLKRTFDFVRYNVFTDEDEALEEDISTLRVWAVHLAAEAIQVAAMCDKWKMGEGSW